MQLLRGATRSRSRGVDSKNPTMTDTRPLRHALGGFATGVCVVTAMGARGLTRAVLCGELLAALVNAEPLPVDARLARAMGTERLEK